MGALLKRSPQISIMRTRTSLFVALAACAVVLCFADFADFADSADTDAVDHAVPESELTVAVMSEDLESSTTDPDGIVDVDEELTEEEEHPCLFKPCYGTRSCHNSTRFELAWYINKPEAQNNWWGWSVNLRRLVSRCTVAQFGMTLIPECQKCRLESANKRAFKRDCASKCGFANQRRGQYRNTQKLPRCRYYKCYAGTTCTATDMEEFAWQINTREARSQIWSENGQTGPFAFRKMTADCKIRTFRRAVRNRSTCKRNHGSSRELFRSLCKWDCGFDPQCVYHHPANPNCDGDKTGPPPGPTPSHPGA